MNTGSMADHASLVARRYDSFQRQAIDQIESDFRSKPAGRFLLVIPTGGGKTFTAVKSIHRLFSAGVLNPSTERVLWVAHRDYLLEQARETFVRFYEMHAGEASFIDRVDFSMVGAASKAYREPSYRLVIVDEAHHAAAPSYLPLFERDDVGVLGLTATPSRHDGAPLEFERESFSIGFPDLVECGVVIKPEILNFRGRRIESSNLESPDALEAFNDEGRNRNIVDGITKNAERFKKVVIYVGTVRHVMALFEALKSSPFLKSQYSISYITQDGNSLGVSRDEFLRAERKKSRSIVVNVSILAEGYDDPSVDTVVMAVPTRSKLVYMQCMGRAIRHNPADPAKRAYVVEMEDDLPNIRYRIDNRWLYAEIADDLEPAVEDSWYDSEISFQKNLGELYERFDVPTELRVSPCYEERKRYGLLLFKYYAGGSFRHIPLILDDETRLGISNFYNFFSSRAVGYREKGYTLPEFLRQAERFAIPGVNEATRPRFLEAMMNAADILRGAAIDRFVAERPWVTYVAFRYRREEIPGDLLEVVATLYNHDEVLDLIRERAYSPGSLLLRAPLPLKGNWGRVLAVEEAAAFGQYLSGLQEIRDLDGGLVQCDAVARYVGANKFPLENSYLSSAIAIVRDGEPHSFVLP